MTNLLGTIANPHNRGDWRTVELPILGQLSLSGGGLPTLPIVWLGHTVSRKTLCIGVLLQSSTLVSIDMPASQPSSPRLYTQEEVQQILNLAIARQMHGGEFTRAQLLEIAGELDISATDLGVAEQAWKQQQSQLQQRQAFNQYRQAMLKQQATKFAVVSAGFALLNVAGMGTTWALYFMVPWGATLSWKVWNVLHPQGESYEQDFQKWQRKHKVRRLFDRGLNYISLLLDRWGLVVRSESN